MTSNQQPSSLRRPSLITISGFLLALIIGPAVSHAAYQEPTTSPPQYDISVIPEVINVTGSATISQQKTGSLLVGSTADKKKLCLNPDLTTFPGTGDPLNCISAWSDLSGLATGFLHRFDGKNGSSALPPFGNSGTGSARDTGYVGWQAEPSGIYSSQLFSFIATVPSGTEDTTPGTIPAAAIRTEGETNANYAAEFLGTLGLSSGSKLCLNTPTGDPKCISQWSDIPKQSNTQLVALQDLHSNSIMLDQGQTSTTGTLQAGSLVAGTALVTTPVAYSCGDNICQSQTETSSNCAIDCQ